MGEERMWQVIEDDQGATEVSDENLRRRIVEGTLRKDAMVWRAGMDEWLPAGDVPGLFIPPPPPARAEKASTAALPRLETFTEQGPMIPLQMSGRRPIEPSQSISSKSMTVANKGGGYIGRHWRGELPLGVSYWVNGVLLTFVATVAEASLGAADIVQAPRLITSSYAILSTLIVAASVWQLVGIWRSARRTIEERRSQGKTAIWAGLAQLGTALGFLSLFGNTLVYRLPNAWANLQIAFGADDTPRHVLRLLNNGTEIELSGGIDFGTGADMQTLLAASPNVRTIDLNSLGGRVAEAQRIRDLIQERHLATYTAARCASACTVAYMGGSPRYLGPSGTLAFHRYSFPGLTIEQDNATNKLGEQALISAGVSQEFAAKAFSTPSSGSWSPDTATLLSAHVVTQVVDGMAFGIAATAQKTTYQDVDRMLTAVASFAALKRVDADTYSQAAQSIFAGIQQGKSLQDVMGVAYPAVPGAPRCGMRA
jgi:ATP-dependent protease ClpP protease subunit